MATNSQPTSYEIVLNRNWFIILIGFLMLASLIPIWICECFPSQNGPGYILVVQMLKEYFNPVFNYSTYYDLNFSLIPNLSFNIIVYLLSFVFPILLSYKIAVSTTVILLPLSVFYFIKIVDPKKIIFGFVSFMYPFNYFQLKGYDCFCFSIPIFFFLFGYLIKHGKQLNAKNITLLSILFLVLYLSHAFSFLLGIFVTLLYMFIYYKRDFKRLLRLMVTFIPALIFFIQYIISMLSIDTGEGHMVEYSSVGTILQEFILLLGYSYSKIGAIIFIMPLCFIGFLIIKKLLSLKQEDTISNIGIGDKIDRLLHKEIMLILTVILSILYFMLPREIFGWGKFNIRMLFFIFIFVLTCPEPFKKRITSRTFIGLVLILSICQYGLMTYHIVEINQSLKDYTSGISVIERNKCLLPIHLEDDKVGVIHSLVWAFNYYNIIKGGATGRSMVKYPGRTVFKYKQPCKEIFPEFNHQNPEATDMERIKQVYDYVLFWGRDEGIFRLFRNQGFVLMHHQGKLWVYNREKVKK
ncbi:MAG: hypothetical protein QME49_01380 [bacterium]|nr:hypothetical protein [bacterium]